MPSSSCACEAPVMIVCVCLLEITYSCLCVRVGNNLLWSGCSLILLDLEHPAHCAAINMVLCVHVLDIYVLSQRQECGCQKQTVTQCWLLSLIHI